MTKTLHAKFWITVLFTIFLAWLALPFLVLHGQSTASPAVAVAAGPAAPAAPQSTLDLICKVLAALAVAMPAISDAVHKFVFAADIPALTKADNAAESWAGWRWLNYAVQYIPRVLGISLKPGA
jgi:hypothetical protein